MKRYSLVSAIGFTVCSSLSLCQFAEAQGRHEHDQRQGQPQQGQQQAQQFQQQAQQSQQQAQQSQQQAQHAQQQAQQQAQQAHAAQEQMQRAQQQGQQRAQQAQQQAQQAQQKNAQEQMQRAQQRQQQAQQAQQQAVQERQQQAQQRNSQEQMQREQQRQQQAQQRDQQTQQHAQERLQRTQQHDQQTQQAQQQAAQEKHQQALQRNAQERTQIDLLRQQNAQQRDAKAQMQKEQYRQQNAWNQNGLQQMPQQGQGVERIQTPIQLSKFDKKNRRLSNVPPLKVQPIPLQKAFPMPNFAEHASGDQLNRARMAQNNMMKHLRAVPLNQAPRNYGLFRTRQLQSYYKNYPFHVNNHQYFINRQNTNYYQVQPNYYPSWYQQNPNWVFSNGFTLANAISVGTDWLGYGWQPYYGAPPVGFICARDYIPTPWFYEAATGQWRQPGLYSYVSEGPGYDYTGPITVEVIEQIVTPNGQVVNVPYLYNAFYYPEEGRWAYENRQGYFIWVDV